MTFKIHHTNHIWIHQSGTTSHRRSWHAHKWALHRCCTRQKANQRKRKKMGAMVMFLGTDIFATRSGNGVLSRSPSRYSKWTLDSESESRKVRRLRSPATAWPGQSQAKVGVKTRLRLNHGTKILGQSSASNKNASI